MTLDGWLTMATVGGVFGLLALTRIGPDLILLAGMVFLIVAGVVTPAEGLQGFSNPGVVTVGVLFVVAAGIRETGAVTTFVDTVLRRPRTTASAQVRVMAPVALLSGFMNNTPLVAMMVPAILDWAKKIRVSPSKLLIPLSYAAILGGMCTLIGTSTNLLIDGMVREAGIPGFDRLGFFEITRVGLPLAALAIGFILVGSQWLLPDRIAATVPLSENPREYVLEMMVEPGSPLDGRTIEQAGLRNLPGVYLMEIERSGEVIAAVSPTQVLHGDDRLIFVGVVDSVVDLQRIRGLKPATEQIFKLNTAPNQRILVEAVVSNSSPIVGKTIRESRFRTRYDAVIIAVARNGERIKKKVGDIIGRPGDTLLMEAHPEFLDRQRNSRDFYLISRIEGYTPPRHEKSWVALSILLGMVLAASVFKVDMVVAAFVAAGAMVLTRCCTGEIARRAVEWRVLLAIGGALGIGYAMRTSGAAETIANAFVSMAGTEPLVALAAIYILAVVFTEIVTNNAAAVLIFPIAQATAQRLGVDFHPFVIALMIASSASLITPIGYQTNLMVYGPGGYRFSDFARMGLPLSILLFVCSMILIPILYPL